MERKVFVLQWYEWQERRNYRNKGRWSVMELQKQLEGHSLQDLVQERLTNRKAFRNRQDERQKWLCWISLAINLGHQINDANDQNCSWSVTARA